MQVSPSITIVSRLIGLLSLTAVAASCAHQAPLAPTAKFNPQSIDASILAAMKSTSAQGLAIAVVDNGQVVLTKAYGKRNGAGDPLQTDTVMYAASLTKAAFGYFVMQLVDEGKLELDRPIGDYLPQPLPTYNSQDDERRYAPWGGLEGDERWRTITPRILLTHSAGFANFSFVEPDGRLRMHFDPGLRYDYSGAGIMLLQFVIERGLGLDVGAEMDRRIFGPAGMSRTSLMWRPDFRPNLADGFTLTGAIEEHDERSKVRVAGSMDTSIADMGKLAAFVARGEGLSAKSRLEFSKAHLPIKSASQFPSLRPLPATLPYSTLAAGLGVISFTGPQGAGFFKGGHNDSTANTWVCVEASKRCVVFLSNDVRIETAYPALVAEVLGETGLPWAWEYPDMKFWDGKR